MSPMVFIRTLSVWLGAHAQAWEHRGVSSVAF